jgi:hypothetical protein
MICCSIDDSRALARAAALSYLVGSHTDWLELKTTNDVSRAVISGMKPCSDSSRSCRSVRVVSTGWRGATPGRSVVNQGSGSSSTRPPPVRSRPAPRISPNQA